MAHPLLPRAFAAFAAASCATTALAQSAPVATAPVAASPLSSMAQGLFALLVVIGLIFAAGWLLKRVGPRTRGNAVVQVLGGASVGPREKVVAVRFGGRTLLLGVAPGHVGLLHADDADAAVPVEPSPAGPPTFAERLRAARGRS